MNAGTCWGKNTIGPKVIDPGGRSVEKPREVTLTLTFSPTYFGQSWNHIQCDFFENNNKIQTFRHIDYICISVVKEITLKMAT
jgi:hypothetical protein